MDLGGGACDAFLLSADNCTFTATPNLPSLNEEQTLKLRLLSLLSLAATVNPLTYDILITTLSISTPSELESLVTTAIYSSLITARLSAASHPPTVKVTSVAPLRDVKPQTLPTMISVLSEWELRCTDVITGIEAEIAKIHADAKKRREREHARASLLEKAMSEPLMGYPGGPELRTGRGSQFKDGAGVKLGSGPSFGGAAGSNKREFSDDEGYHGDDAPVEPSSSSRMDIDEGPSASKAGPSGGTSARHAKRVLGKKKS